MNVCVTRYPNVCKRGRYHALGIILCCCVICNPDSDVVKASFIIGPIWLSLAMNLDTSMIFFNTDFSLIYRFTLTLQWRQAVSGVSNHRHFHSLSDNSYRLTTKKTLKPDVTTLLAETRAGWYCVRAGCRCYHQISNIRRIKCQNLNDSRLVCSCFCAIY